MSIPSPTSEAPDFPRPSKLIKVQEVVHQLLAQKADLEEKLKCTPPAEQMELQNKIAAANKLYQQGKAHVEGFSRVVEFIFQLYLHLLEIPEVSTMKDRIHTWEVQINEKMQSLASLQPAVCIEAVREISGLHRQVVST